MGRLWSWLLPLLASCPATISENIIGFMDSSPTIIVNENISAVEREVCVLAYSIDPGAGPFTVDVIYVPRSARDGEDFEDTPISLNFSTTNQSSCFTYTLINDDIYEVKEEFFINLTTTHSMLNIRPHNRIVTVNDDDGLEIRWQRPEYTVREEEGGLEVCAVLIGTYVTSIAVLNIQLVEGTAMVGVDYRRLVDILQFEVGGPDIHCFDIDIITDIAFEEEKNFTVATLAIELDRVIITPSATIVITDYNVIVEQQPQSVCEGLENILNTLPINFACNVTWSDDDCAGIQCTSEEFTTTLDILPCNNSIVLAVVDENSTTLLNSTVPSKPHPQTLTTGRDSQHLNISVLVVTSNESEYYIVMLESSFGLDFPMTAIPLLCLPTDCCPTNRRFTLYIIVGMVGGTIFVILAMILIGTCLYVSVRKMKSKKKKVPTATLR